MNLERRTVETFGLWYRALAEERADSKSVEEWMDLAMTPLKIGLVFMGLTLLVGFGFSSEYGLIAVTDGTVLGEAVYYLQSAIGIGLWASVVAGLVLWSKAMVSEYRTED